MADRAPGGLTIPQTLIWTLCTAAIGWAATTLVDAYRATGTSENEMSARNRELDDVKVRLGDVERKTWDLARRGPCTQQERP